MHITKGPRAWTYMLSPWYLDCDARTLIMDVVVDVMHRPGALLPGSPGHAGDRTVTMFTTGSNSNHKERKRHPLVVEGTVTVAL